MKDLRDLNRILAAIPSLAMFCIWAIGAYGILYFHEIPVYGIHPDPSSLKISWINGFAILPFALSVVSFPASIFITIHLLLNKIKFRNSDKVGLVFMLINTLGFFLLKYFVSDFFAWIMD